MANQGLRPEEQWAQTMLAAATGLRVLQHDDGSVDGMHDLDLLDGDVRVGAVEVTAAADGELIALWNLMNGRNERWIDPCLAGGWIVALRPNARAKAVRKDLPEILFDLEQLGVKRLEPEEVWPPHPIASKLDSLGVVTVDQSDTDFSGSIYVTIELDLERSGGAVADTADAIVGWVSDFLKHPDRQDVRKKLADSGTLERHAFVIVPGFSTAPFSVSDPLMRNGTMPPLAEPELPDEITSVWVVSTWTSGIGFRWSPGSKWERFEKPVQSQR